MRQNRAFGIVVLGVLGAIGLQAQRADAALDYPDRARRHTVEFVRAMDECTGPGITTLNPGSIAGCAQANVVTDSSVTGLRHAKLSVARARNDVKLRLRVVAIEPSATSVGLRLTIRTSNTLGLPASTTKTYEDQTIICGETAGGLCGNSTAPNASGRVNFRQDLSDCLSANGLNSSFMSQGNIQIIDAALINCNTGKVFAVPGVLAD